MHRIINMNEVCVGMKNILYILICFSCFLGFMACGKLLNRKVTGTGQSQGKHMEMYYQYENLYRADSLLDKVNERIYRVVDGLLIPDDTIEYTYIHRVKNGNPVRTEEYKLLEGNSRSLTEVTNYLTDGHEIFVFIGPDTIPCEQIRKDSQGRIVYEKRFIGATNVPEFEMETPNSLLEKSYTYDTLNRLTSYHVFNSHGTDTVNQQQIIIYKGDTEEIVSEYFKDFSSPENSYTVSYRSEQRGDTLVQYGYREEGLDIIIKTRPDYRKKIMYNKNGSAYVTETKYAQDDYQIEVIHDFYSTDSLFYKANLLMRQAHLSPEMYSIYEYEYNTHLHIISQRYKTTFYETP